MWPNADFFFFLNSPLLPFAVSLTLPPSLIEKPFGAPREGGCLCISMLFCAHLFVLEQTRLHPACGILSFPSSPFSIPLHPPPPTSTYLTTPMCRLFVLLPPSPYSPTPSCAHSQENAHIYNLRSPLLPALLSLPSSLK